jgi:DNA-binding Xre family transcriptional regulator
MAHPKKKSPQTRAKVPVRPMPARRRREVSAQFKDDVLAKLVGAFFRVAEKEGWGKRDLAMISGMDETAIGHILAGRRKNVKLETIAVLTRAMRTRPELLLHDLRPRDNNVARPQINSAADALNEMQIRQASHEQKASVGVARPQPVPGSLREPEVVFQ